VDLAVLAANIRAARDAAKLTQDDAAHAAGMRTAVYSRIERGEVDPRLSSLVKTAQALGIDLAERDGLLLKCGNDCVILRRGSRYEVAIPSRHHEIVIVDRRG
jgi:transcriptional regulator with XRE-family HTH domain